ncbi:MAG: hypothetical protein RQ761_12685 [Bacteroidales bacterium]|nr:hypothetical protein [Bacteroidales bacterium]
MIDCKTFQNKLLTFGEGSFDSGSLQQMEAHARTCPNCASLLADYRRMEAAIAAEKNEQPNPFAGTRIMQYLDNHQAKEPVKPVRILQPLAATLALFLALSLGFLIGSYGIERIQGNPLPSQEIELLKDNLFIPQFMDEDLYMLSGQ